MISGGRLSPRPARPARSREDRMPAHRLHPGGPDLRKSRGSKISTSSVSPLVSASRRRCRAAKLPAGPPPTMHTRLPSRRVRLIQLAVLACETRSPKETWFRPSSTDPWEHLPAEHVDHTRGPQPCPHTDAPRRPLLNGPDLAGFSPQRMGAHGSQNVRGGLGRHNRHEFALVRYVERVEPEQLARRG